MTSSKRRPAIVRACALTVAGLDPGGGAGILADLRAFHAAGVFGTAVATLLTVQSTSGLRAAHAVKPAHVQAQLEELLGVQHIVAAKTGALGSRAIVLAVAGALAQARAGSTRLQIVVDPVMLPTRGNVRLLDVAAQRALRDHLLPLTDLLTANVAEAELLSGMRIARVADAHRAAQLLLTTGARAVLIKGGHLKGPRSVDVAAFADHQALEFAAPRLTLPASVHGTGCILSALICGRLAIGDALEDAITWSKQRMQAALLRCVNVGGTQRVLEP